MADDSCCPATDLVGCCLTRSRTWPAGFGSTSLAELASCILLDPPAVNSGALDRHTLCRLLTSFPDSFRAQAQDFLSRNPQVRHSWSSAAGFIYLEIHNEDPLGFAVRANVSSEYALVIADGTVSYKSEPKRGEEMTAAAIRFFSVLAILLTRDARLREIRRGSRTSQWILERRDGLRWHRIARQFSINPLNYFGRGSETVRQNRLVRDSLAAV